MVIFAFTFGLPGLLWGLGLASAPIIIHLLNRQKHRTVDWAAMKWLLEAIQQRRRRIRLEQWFLLLLRTVVILLVVLAMAKPSFETANALFVADSPATHHIIVFDNSLSMHYAPTNWNRWERAKGMAQSILDDAETGDMASVVVMGSASTVLVGDPSPYLRDVTEEIDAIKPEHGTARVSTAADQVMAVLKLSRAASKRIYLITDMQRSTWVGEEGNQQVGELGKKLRALSDQAQFNILDVSGPDSTNLAVVGLDSADPLLVKGRQTVVRARVANFSSAPAENIAVEFLVDGDVEATETISLPAGEQRVVPFGVSFREAGERICEVRIPNDSLRIDNQRWLVAKVRDSLAVLIIEGKPSGLPFASESDYLRVALAPHAEGAATALVQPETKLESDLIEAELDQWDLVVLCNVGQLTEAETQRLRDFLRRGGGVLFFLGSQTNLAAYNEILFKDGAGILPAGLLEAVGGEARRDNFFTFNPLNYSHPIVELFRDREDAGLLTAKIFRYVKAKLPAESSAQVAIAFNTGDPAVILASKERGMVGLVTTSASLDWNTWAISPSFVPVIQELARQLVVGRVRAQRSLVGEPLIVPLPDDAPGEGVTVTPPGAEAPLPVRVQEADGTRQILFAETVLSGIYKIQFTGESTSLAASVDTVPAESDLTRLTESDLKALFPGWDFTLVDRWEGGATRATAGPATGGDFHRQLLGLALILLFLETFLAWKFSHHS
ncbi:MAG: BatA domain-containing protein [Planctomycetota bacterium]